MISYTVIYIYINIYDISMIRYQIHTLRNIILQTQHSLSSFDHVCWHGRHDDKNEKWRAFFSFFSPFVIMRFCGAEVCVCVCMCIRVREGGGRGRRR